jgi:hypothetical protein
MKKTFADGIALGVFLTLLVVFSLALLFDFRFFGNDADDYIQTLVTSVVAMGAGYLALWGIRHQVQQNFEVEEARRLNSLRAARASLPLALSDLVSTAQKVLGRILDGTAKSPEELVTSISSPTVLETISKCIEYSDTKSADRLAQIIRYIQLVRARFDVSHFANVYPPNEQDWGVLGHNRTSYIVDWAVLVAICNSAFGFARGSVPTIPSQISLADVSNALTTAHVFIEQYPRLEEMIVTRSEAGRLERDFSVP